MARSDNDHLGSGDQEGRRVRRLFSEIAPRYDLLNHLLSLNVDRRWRRRAVDALGPLAASPRYRVLDACAGTFDMSLEIAGRSGFAGLVVALDFARPMLIEGRHKLGGRPVRAICGDGLQLPFGEGIFDAAVVAFGVRNLSSLDRGLGELYRVLKAGGTLVILEFSTPPSRWLRPLYHFYFRRILPGIGRVISGHPWAYSYLPESVRTFPDPFALADRLRAVGFENVDWSYLTGGIAALHRGHRSP